GAGARGLREGRGPGRGGDPKRRHHRRPACARRPRSESMEIARLTHAALVGVAVTLIAGCGFFSKTIPPSPSMHAALESASASSDPSTAVTAVTTQSTFGFQAPYMPVVIPP